MWIPHVARGLSRRVPRAIVGWQHDCHQQVTYPAHSHFRPVDTCEAGAYPSCSRVNTTRKVVFAPCYHPAFVAHGGGWSGEHVLMVRSRRSVPVYSMICYADKTITCLGMSTLLPLLSVIRDGRPSFKYQKAAYSPRGEALLMQSVFCRAARRTSAGHEDECGLAAPVGKKRIGLSRCPDARLWGLNDAEVRRRCGDVHWTGASGGA